MKSHSLEAKYFQMNSRVQWSEWQEWWYDPIGKRIDPCTRGVSLSDSRSSHQCGKGNRSFDDACNCAGDSGGTGYGSAAEEQTTEVPSATESSGGSVLTIIIDSMGKSKLVWPQYAFQQPKSLANLTRPRMVLTAAIAHGWTVESFLTDDEVTSHGASHFC